MRDTWDVPSPRTCMLNIRALELSSEDMKRDFEYVKSVVQLNGEALRFASRVLRNNAEIVTLAVKNTYKAMKFASEDLMSSWDFVWDMCIVDYRALEFVDPEILDDEEFMLSALEVNGGTVQFFSDRLKSDRDVMTRAVDMCGHHDMLSHCASELRKDRAFVLDVCLINGLALQHAIKELRGDHEIVHTAVGQNGLALAYASSKLRGDKQIVLRAVGQNGKALVYASADLQSDRGVQFMAHRGNPSLRVESMLRKARCSSAPGVSRQRPNANSIQTMLSQRPHTSTGVRSIAEEGTFSNWNTRRNSDRTGSTRRSSSSPVPAIQGRPSLPSRPMTAGRAVSQKEQHESDASDTTKAIASMKSKFRSETDDFSSKAVGSFRPSALSMETDLSDARVRPLDEAEEEAQERIAQYNEKVLRGRDQRHRENRLHEICWGDTPPADTAADEAGLQARTPMPEKTLLRSNPRTEKGGFRQSILTTAFSSPDSEASARRLLRAGAAGKSLAKWAGDSAAAWKPGRGRRMKGVNAEGVDEPQQPSKKALKIQTKSLKELLDREKELAAQKSSMASKVPPVVGPRETNFTKSMRFGQNLSLPAGLRKSFSMIKT